MITGITLLVISWSIPQ